MHMKKKIAAAAVILVILAVLLFPIKTRFRDGGTTFYTAILFRVISWHAIISADEMKTGTEVHFIPNNFHDYAYYFDRSPPDATPAASGPAMTTRPDLAMQREEEKDGLVLRVDIGYLYQFAGEPFVLTATITNTTDEDITYGVGSGTLNMHMEIKVETPFIDMDTYGKAFTEKYRYATLKAGETFTQTMNLMPGYVIESDVYWDLSMQQIHWYPAGEYRGTASFAWITGPIDNPGEPQRLDLEFPVILI